MHGLVYCPTKFKEYNISLLDDGASVNSVFQSNTELSKNECKDLKTLFSSGNYEEALKILR
jgi:hypothetical protein